jgi:hypothetical protein
VIYNKDTGPKQKIHGAYLGPGSNWQQASWFSTGHFHPLDAENTQTFCGMDLLMVAQTAPLVA